MPATLRFGGFEFHLDSGELIGEGRRIRLEPQPARLLAALAIRPGQVVSRDELRGEVWPEGTFVDFERGLSYCVRQIRSALGDSASTPRFIETLPRRGYRFVAGVEGLARREPGAPSGPEAGSAAAAGGPLGGELPTPPMTAGQGAFPSARPNAAAIVLAAVAAVLVLIAALILTSRLSPAVPGRAATRPTLAVTLFDNETGERDLDRMAQIFTDTLVERLARAPSRWSVIGNAAVLRAPRPFRNLEAIGSSLHADFIVLGQILPGKDGLTVLTHLIRARDGRHLWVGRFTSPAAIDAVLPDRVAESVAVAAEKRIGRSN